MKLGERLKRSVRRMYDLEMIVIKVSKGVPYVWDPRDWVRLRVEHGILGVFDGAEGEGWTSNIHVHFPVRLSDVETRYLINHGIAKTVWNPSLEDPDAQIDGEKVDRVIERTRREQAEGFLEKRRNELEVLADKVLEGKRKKGKQVPSREEFIAQEVQKISSQPFHMFRTHLEDPYLNADEYIPYNFPFPSSRLEKLRLAVYEDFHYRKKYFVTPGIKFGGDYLAYQGDPQQFHSRFIIMCQDDSRRFSDLHIKSQLRLANTVKKTLLIAHFKEGTETLLYAVPRSDFNHIFATTSTSMS